MTALAVVAALREHLVARSRGSVLSSTAGAPSVVAVTASSGAPVRSAAPPVFSALRTKNTSGRSGTYYVPAAHAALVPVLVFLHGTGGSGSQGVASFRALADEKGFAVLGPDSRRAPDGSWTWEVGDHPDDITDDRRHVMACLQEMLGREHLDLDPAHILAVGHSGGGSSAPYLATNEDPFTAFAVLHGGAFPGGFGVRHVPGWFSTGSSDLLRPPAMVSAAADAARRTGLDVEMRVFSGGHDMSEEERAAVVRWWLGR